MQGSSKYCSIHHLRKLHNKWSDANITKTPGNGHQVNFEDILQENIKLAMEDGIEGPYQVKIALDSVNMTAGIDEEQQCRLDTGLQIRKRRWKL